MKEDVRTDLAQTNERLKEKLLQWLPAPGRIPTAIDGLMLSRFDEISPSESSFYQP